MPPGDLQRDRKRERTTNVHYVRPAAAIRLSCKLSDFLVTNRLFDLESTVGFWASVVIFLFNFKSTRLCLGGGGTSLFSLSLQPFTLRVKGETTSLTCLAESFLESILP